MEHILGDYRGFVAEQEARLARLGISIAGYALSHLAFRTPTMAEYLQVRARLEQHALANVENVWNGRPISKVLLATPLQLEGGRCVDLIELIPPVHQADYRMGLEHLGVVLGDDLPQFATRHASVITGRQFQTAAFQPYFIRFENRTNVKFYPYSLQAACISEGQTFDGFRHCI